MLIVRQVKSRLADLEGSLPRSLDLVDQYDSRVGKLRAQLADVNASVAVALNAAAEGETRATMAEENAAIVQREVAIADKASRAAMEAKNSAEAMAFQAERDVEAAQGRYGNAAKELTKLRVVVKNTETRLKMAEQKAANLTTENERLRLSEKAKLRAEEVARSEMQRSEDLRKQRNALERQTQVAGERIRELEGTFNAGQSDWWQRKLLHAERWNDRRERLYESNQSEVQVRDGIQVDAQWQALNDMTRAVDVSLRRTCGQLTLRTMGVQTDTTWFKDHPMAAHDSVGERHAWQELVHKKEGELVDKQTKILQYEKRLSAQELQLEALRTSESRLKSFKKQFGPNREEDKNTIQALERKVERLGKMLGDPNPALRGVHRLLKDSERNEEEAQAIAADSQLAAKKAAEDAARMAEEAAVMESAGKLLNAVSMTFVFQKTGRAVGIVWGNRTRFGVNEVFVESLEENSQAWRHNVPLGFVLKKVKHSKGQPDISKLKYKDVVAMVKAGLQYSPLEITIAEPPSDEMMEADQALAGAGRAHQQTDIFEIPQIDDLKPKPTSGAPTLPAISGPGARANILRQLAAATNEREDEDKHNPNDEEEEGEEGEGDEGAEGVAKAGSAGGQGSGKTGGQQLVVSRSESDMQLEKRPRSSKQRRPKSGATREPSHKERLQINRTSGLDSRFAIAALTRSEDGRQREATRNVQLQKRCEALSTDLVIQTDLVSALQDELSRAESLAAKDMKTVATEKKRTKSLAARNGMAALLLREVHDIAAKLLEELQGVARLQLEAAAKTVAISHGNPRPQEISDYAVLYLGMEAESLPELGWIAETALVNTLLSGWRVSRDPKDSSALVFLHEADGRIEHAHPMQQRCQKLYLHLLRWGGLSTQVGELGMAKGGEIQPLEDRSLA